MSLPWFITRRRIIRGIAEAYGRSQSPEAVIDPEFERRALEDYESLCQTLVDEDTRRSPARLVWLAEREQNRRREEKVTGNPVDSPYRL